jgi:hypothetical protein
MRLGLPVSLVAGLLVGCAGPLYEPWLTFDGSSPFGLESCVATGIDCRKLVDTTRDHFGVISYVDRDGFAYEWRSERLEKSPWRVVKANGRLCWHPVVAGTIKTMGPCWTVSGGYGTVKVGDIFSLKKRYESGIRKLPSTFNVTGFADLKELLENPKAE